MGLYHLLIAALAVGATLAADPCACVTPDQKIDPIKNPMIFFQQPTEGGVTNGKTCNMACTFTAKLDVDDPDYSLQIQLLTNQLLGGSLSVDGMNDTVTITSNTPPGLMYPRSFGDSITINFKEGTATELGVFMIVVQKVKGRPAAPVTKAPVVVASTAAYDPKFTHNPKLVANDIMIVLDLSSDNLPKFKTFATGLINELEIKPKSLESTAADEDCDAGSRLSVVGLSALSGFDNLYAPYWTTTAEQAIGNIESLVQISKGPYYFKPLDTNYAYGFASPPGAGKTTTNYTSCQNRGKILILLTSSAPFEYDSSRTDGGKGTGTPFTDFLNLGVHQILVHYNMDTKTKNMTYYNLYDNFTKVDDHSNVWNFFQMGGVDSDVVSFINTFLVDSSDDMTCQLKSSTVLTEVPIGADKATTAGSVPIVNVDLPPYYNAKGVPTGKWDTVRHYCNFQETTINLIRDPTITKSSTGTVPVVPVCVKVYYDLETGKDFVSIFSGDPAQPALQTEVVRLTGRDVSGTSFDLPDAIGSIVFTSDEKNVYDGFHAEITRGECV